MIVIIIIIVDVAVVINIINVISRAHPGPDIGWSCLPDSVIWLHSKSLLASISASAMVFSVFCMAIMLMPQCDRCSACTHRRGSNVELNTGIVRLPRCPLKMYSAVGLAALALKEVCMATNAPCAWCVDLNRHSALLHASLYARDWRLLSHMIQHNCT